MNEAGSERIGRFEVSRSPEGPVADRVEIVETPQERRWREMAYKRMERRRRRAMRKAIFFAALAVILLVVLVILAARMDSAARDIALPEAVAESEETTMHVVAPDWDELMIRAVLDGNEQAGTECSESGGLPYTYDDLYLLAKIVEKEQGVDWPDAPVIALANVVLNRVSSPHFPNTIREVLYATGPIQYEPVYSSGWEAFSPAERNVRLAQRALNGERAIGEEVVYQALFPQGSVTIMTWYDNALGTTTYFCEE